MNTKGKDGPLVSVLLPIYEPNIEWLEECVDSVACQTYQNLELVVVNDGSDPEINEWVRELVGDRVVVSLYHQKSNAGFSRATNTAFRRSRGAYVAPIGQDDKWKPRKIEKQIRTAQQGYDLVFTDVLKIDANGLRIGKIGYPQDPSFSTIVQRCFPIYESSLISKDVIGERDMLNDSFRVASDWNLWVELWEKAEVTCVREPLTFKRYHDDKETSRNYDEAVLESERMILDVIDREGLEKSKIMRRFYKQKTKTLLRYGFINTSLYTFLKYLSERFLTKPK